MELDTKRTHYPWGDLGVGEHFTITQDNPRGVNNRRQLCYAANKASVKSGEGRRYKARIQTDATVKVTREV